MARRKLFSNASLVNDLSTKRSWSFIPQGFDPTNITGLTLWLDATDASTITTVSSKVSQWNDKSGNGNHFTADVGKRPAQSTSFFGGVNAIDFTDGASTMYNSSVTLPTYITAFVVARIPAATYTTAMFLYHSAQVTLADGFQWQTDTSAFYVTRNSGEHDASSGNWTTKDANKVFIFSYGAAEQQFYMNNTAVTMGVIGGSLRANSNSTQILTLASKNNGTSGFLKAYVGDVIIYNTQLSSTDRQRVVSYLTSKYSLT